MFNKIKITFTQEIQNWLVFQGYTHIYQKGIEGDGLKAKDELNNDYLIVPIKVDDPIFRNKLYADTIEEIASCEINDMANGEPPIRFIVELPINLFENYLRL